MKTCNENPSTYVFSDLNLFTAKYFFTLKSLQTESEDGI